MDPFGLEPKWDILCGKLDEQSALLRQLLAQEREHPNRPTDRVPRTQTYAFTTTTTGWNQIVPPQGGQWGVSWLLLVAGGTVSVQLGTGQSIMDAHPLPSITGIEGGIIPLAVNLGFQATISYPSTLFTTDPNLGIFLELSTDETVGGYISCFQLDRMQEGF